MLVSLVAILAGVWLCARAAARRFTGWAGFAAFYALAVLAVPNAVGLPALLVLRDAFPDGGTQLAARIVVIGMAAALVFYPLGYWRQRLER